MSSSRYARIKAPSEYSCYGFGVSHSSEAGRAEKYKFSTVELDARSVTPTHRAPEVQIAVRITQVYERGRAVSMINGLILRPEDAEALALQIAPRLAAMVKTARRVASLNPDAGEIGEGMLRTLVEEARAALGEGR